MRSRLGWLLRPYAWPLLAAVLLMIGLTAINIVVPLMVAMVFDRVFEHSNWSLLWLILAGLLGLYVGRNLLYFFSKYTAIQVGENVAFEVRNRLFERLQHMNLQYYRANKPGQLSSRVMNDSFVIQTFIQDELPKLLQAGLLFLGIVATIYAMNWQLALASTVVLPLHLATFHYFKRPIKAASSTAQAHMAEATGNLIEKFLGMEVIKGFNAEQRESEAFENAIDASRQSQLRSHKFHVGQKVAADLLIGLGTIGLIGFGGYQVLNGTMQKGAFLAFFWFIKELYPTVLVLMSGFAKMTKASAGVDRVNEVLHASTREAPGGNQTPEIKGQLAFENVTFRYPDGPLVLRGIDFQIEPGEVCAIVGPSGAGKSTLVNLVPRFHEPERGRLVVDGVDAREIDRRHLRQAIGIAFQECFLFNSSILENLRYARPKASRREIVDVAQRTGAHDFIMKLPHKYDTVVGEKGVSLSRGQKQLINLTRAMLKNPCILVLDEATASIDEAREKQTVPAILEFMRGKTTLMITHRPEMLKHADKVLQIVDGEVVSFGPPQHKTKPHDGDKDAPAQEPETMTEASHHNPQRPHRPGAPRGPHHHEKGEGPDEPDARPSGSGVWRGLSIIALAGLLAMNLLIGPHTPRALAAEGDGNQQNTEWAAGERPEDQQEKPQSQKQPQEQAQNNAQNDAQNNEQKNAKQQQNKQQAQAEQAQANNNNAPQNPQPPQQEQQQPAPNGGEGRFIAVAGLSPVEVQELLTVVTSQLRAELGYRSAPPAAQNMLPPAPPELQNVTALSRAAQGGGQRLLQLGFKTFVSQPTHIWVYGQLTVNGEAMPNNELEQVQTLIDEAQQGNANKAEQMTVADLKSRRLRLSYVDPGHATGVLKSLGYQVIEYTEGKNSAGKDKIINPTAKVDPKNLPIIVSLPGTKAVDLVAGAESKGRGTFGLTTPSLASELPQATSSARQMELMILYNPAEPAQMSDVVRHIRDNIDIAAQQLLIEAMVLEISETGLEKLGVDWELSTPFGSGDNVGAGDLKLGRLPSFNARNDEEATLDLSADDVFGHWRIEVEALVRDGEAEILSRPSVLTLDNRQASIRVGEEIPVAKSFRGVSGGDNVQLDFAYIPVGILLNVRPRITARSEEISLQVDGVVSAQVPGEDLVIRDEDGNELGRAPRISTRRVQTYARVGNNTPFIIGGLISKNNTRQVDKVPVLGDIPIIKHAFRSTNIDNLKREVIIVLTPYVLPDQQVVGRNLPKDDDAFDSFGNELFRDAYRIRGEDVFDLSFLTENPQLLKMQRLADQVVANNQELSDTYPFNHFAKDRIPGERILVFRQMYEVIKRKDLDNELSNDQIIFFEPDAESESGFGVGFLEETIGQLAKQAWAGAQPDQKGKGQSMPADPYKALQRMNKALAMTYTMRQRTTEAGDLINQPVVNLRLVDCADGTEWSRLLWELNQPDAEGRQRWTILIREKENLTRIRRAVLLKRTIGLNASEGSLTLKNFTIGRQLLMPTVKEQKMYLIDSDVAKYFFFTEQYYPALQRELHKDIEALKGALGDAEYSQYLRTTPDLEQGRMPRVPQQPPRREQ